MSFASRKPYNRPARAPEGQWRHDKTPTGPRTHAAPGRKGPAAQSEPSNATLLVSNLHYEVSPKDLISIFGTIGTLTREPLVRYDASGRSTGEAVIWFENTAEATRAKKQFTGILAKGQPMKIAFYTAPSAPRAPAPRREGSSFKSTHSLLTRVEKPPLAQRLTQEESAKLPKGPKAAIGPRTLAGPVRSRPSRSNANPAPSGPKKDKKPKTAEELDQELDAFMGDAPRAIDTTLDGSDELISVTDAGDVDMV